MTEIAYCAIYPGIGIARVGDSPGEYFIGPERPGEPAPPAGGFKDAEGRVKRQAARFRVFAFDSADNVVQELTDADAEITWTVHLVNRKAAAERFRPDPELPVMRNGHVPSPERETLVIDSGPREITGRNVSGDPLDSETFCGNVVDLGELRTDDAGRLLVLGGHGRSGSPTDAPLVDFADNDQWYDDVSDGPVTVRVMLKGGVRREMLEVRHTSWIVVAPPDYAPSLTNLVTLYDVAEQAAVENGQRQWPAPVYFDRDIEPLLRRSAGYQWVNASAYYSSRRS